RSPAGLLLTGPRPLAIPPGHIAPPPGRRSPTSSGFPVHGGTAMLTSLAHLAVWAVVTASPPCGPAVPAQGTPPEFLPVSPLDWDRPLHLPGPLLIWAPHPLELLPEGQADSEPAQPAPRNWGWRWVPPTPLSELFAITDPFRLEPFSDPREFDGK